MAGQRVPLAERHSERCYLLVRPAGEEGPGPRGSATRSCLTLELMGFGQRLTCLQFSKHAYHVNDGTRTSSRDFPATPDAYFARWIDHDTWPQWSPDTEWVRLDGPVEVGTRGVLKPGAGQG